MKNPKRLDEEQDINKLRDIYPYLNLENKKRKEKKKKNCWGKR